MTTILFACIQNAGRSQMAAAFFNALADPAHARAISAGTRPAAHVHPEVATTMRESGIDLTSARPQLLTGDLASRVNILVTMGCGEECPVVPGVERVEWAIDDPRGRPADQVRKIRDDIRARVARLVETRGWAQRR